MTEIPVFVSNSEVTAGGFVDTVKVELATGQQGARGSRIFTGSVSPNTLPLNSPVWGGYTDFKVGDIYIKRDVDSLEVWEWLYDGAEFVWVRTVDEISSADIDLDPDLTAIAGLTGTGILKRTGAAAWQLDTSSYLTSNQTITLSGDATGSGGTSIAVALANSGVTAGTYNNNAAQVSPFTVDSKGRVTSIGSAVSIQIAESQVTNLVSDLANKAPLASPTFTGTVTLPSTTSIGNVSSTELDYLDGVSSNIQTQISAVSGVANAALPKAGGTMTGYLYNLQPGSNIAMGGNKITGLAAGTSNGDAVRYEQLETRHHYASVGEPTSVSWNSLTAPGLHPKLMQGLSNPDGPGPAYYFYVQVFEYAGTGNVTQYAIPYSGAHGVGTFQRSRHSGIWTRWSGQSARAFVQSTAPDTPTNGDLWVDTSTPTWSAPTLLNSWANYGGAFHNAGYFKDSLGFVHLRGLVKSGTTGYPIFTLPAGYRPTAAHMFSVHAGGAEARVEAVVDGNVYVAAYSGGNNNYVSLDGITFATF